MWMLFPRVVIAGMAGDAGKTLISVGVLAALRREGIPTAAFKKGPDFIDAAWLGLAAHGTARHLDLYMMGPDAVYGSFVSHAVTDGVNLIEGNRGLFDGMESGDTSTAAVAKLLRAPVVIVCAPTKMTRTAAAHVLGCQYFDPALDIAGVILNRVGSPRHEQVIRAAIEDACGIPVLGALPKVADGQGLPDRHLGLVPPQEARAAGRRLETCARLCRDHLDMEALRRIARRASPLPTVITAEEAPCPPAVRIGVFSDSAFTFYYPDNLEALQRAGATLVPISALCDTRLPAVDALYLGGGFPETHADRLERNGALRTAVRQAAEAGLPMYAECGGLIYLTEALRWHDRTTRMAGVLPITVEMQETPQGHGYSEIEVDAPNPFLPIGTVYRGHEFHYTRIVSGQNRVRSIAAVHRGVGCFNRRDGLLVRNVLAGYTHLHAGGARDWAAHFVQAAAAFKYVEKGVIC